MENIFSVAEAVELDSVIKPTGELILTIKFKGSRQLFLRAIFSEVFAQHIALDGLVETVPLFQDIMNVFISLVCLNCIKRRCRTHSITN